MATVLIVEDDRGIQEVLAEILSDQGYTIALADHGQAALEQIVANPRQFGAMILDAKMPVMDGQELLSQLQLQGLTVPTVVISASKSRGQIPGVPWLQKPFSIEDLESVVAELLRGHPL